MAGSFSLFYSSALFLSLLSSYSSWLDSEVVNCFWLFSVASSVRVSLFGESGSFGGMGNRRMETGLAVEKLGSAERSLRLNGERERSFLKYQGSGMTGY